MTPSELKHRLQQERDAGNTRIGGDAERLVAEYLRDRGHSVATVHAQGTDLFVAGHLEVDVKSHLALTKKSGKRPKTIATRDRQPGVQYPLVAFFSDRVSIFDCPMRPPEAGPVELSWEEVCSLIARKPRAKREAFVDPSGVRAAQRDTCAGLTAWIEAQWGLHARVGFRGNPAAQSSMAKRQWGPQSFYQDPKGRGAKYDLVVMIFFDGAHSRGVLAYPMSRWVEIAWKRKDVGPNPTGAMTFDPGALDPRFAFSNLAEFKEQFLHRFL